MMRQLAAEAVGTAFLLVAVVGSGIMASAISGGHAGVALLANALATGFALYVLIATLGPVSGAHLNPAVTLTFLFLRRIAPRTAAAYILVQIVAAIAGVWIAHMMFELPLIQVSTTLRAGGAKWLSEFIATFGLIFVILGGIRAVPAQVPALVGAYIAGAFWFTSSSGFANPAVTIARGLTDTAPGIAPSGIPAFVAAQIVAAIVAAIFLPRLFSD